MRRVMILGQPGAGKSTLARAIGRVTGLPVIHVDLIHWLPGWTERPRDEKIAMALAEEAKASWVFEGGLSATWQNRMARADTVIHLDFLLWLRAWRVFKRTLRDYGRTRADLPDDCPEYFSAEFWGWIWRTRNTARVRMSALIASAPSDKTCVTLSNPAQVRAYLDELETKYA